MGEFSRLTASIEVPFALLELARWNTLTFRGIACDFEVYAHEKCIERRGRPKLKGSRGSSPRKCRILRASEKPSPTISEDISINKSEGKCRSVVLSVTFAVLIKPWTQNRMHEGLRRKSSRNPFNLFNMHVRICPKDATALLLALIPVRAVLKQTWTIFQTKCHEIFWLSRRKGFFSAAAREF